MAIVFYPKITIFVIWILAFLWFVKFALKSEKFALFVGLFFVLASFLSELKYAYPVIINLGLFLVFYLSLKTTPAITKVALLKHDLSQEQMDYTRKLTQIWALFFISNAIISYLLSLLDDKSYWAFYCGILSYVLVGFLIGIEILYRKAILKYD